MGKNYCQNGCDTRCDCNCDCNCYQPNCDMLLESFHKSVREAFELFTQSAEFEKDALRETAEAIEALKKSIAKDDEGEKVFENAIHSLDCSGCDFACNKDSCRCKALERKVTANFDFSEKLKDEALCLLKEAAEKLYASAKAQEEGVQLAQDYSKCVHEKHHCR